MFPRASFLVVAFLCAACIASAARADEPAGPWRPDALWALQGFGAVHLADRSDVNNYINDGEVEEFGTGDGNGYASRAVPAFGGRLALVKRRFIADVMVEYHRQTRDGPGTGATLSGFNLLFHAGADLIHSRVQLYPFVGLGWSYTNFVVNGDDRIKPRFPDFAGAKEGVPADIGLGFEVANPIWLTRENGYRKALHLPIFIHAGYQGEVVTFFWQIKHGELARSVQDRFMGPYLRVGLGAGKGSWVR